MQKFKVLSSRKQRKTDKSVRVLFPRDTYETMRAAFIASEASSCESYAIAQCGLMADSPRKNWTYMVRSVHIPAADDILEQSSITVTPRAEFMEAILSDAAGKNNVIMEVHTHVGSREPNFSWVDMENGLENGRFLRACGLRFAMAVVGSDGFSLCEYDSDHDALQTPGAARISVIGRDGVRDVMFHGSNARCELPQMDSMRVSIVGLNGIGFGIAGILADMEVKKFTLYDEGIVDDSGPDVLAYTSDKGKKKTKAAANMLKKMAGDLEMSQPGDVASLKAALKCSDVIFICGVDASIRPALNEVSLKYFIPCIEARTLVKNGRHEPYGALHIYIPSATACIGCFSDAQAGLASIPDMSSVDVNKVVSSIAVREFMDLVYCGRTSLKGYDYVEYDPATGATVQKSIGSSKDCPMCGRGGMLGAGDERKQMAKAGRIRKAKKE
jgi:molybdopterin/thiamine biosynthesis adenylyltransferase